MSAFEIGRIVGLVLVLCFLAWLGNKINIKTGVWSKDDFKRKATPTVKVCPMCGGENSPDYRFCGNCGARLEESK